MSKNTLHDKFIQTTRPYYYFEKKGFSRTEFICPECGIIANVMQTHIRDCHYEDSIYSAISQQPDYIPNDEYHQALYQRNQFEAMKFHLKLIRAIYGDIPGFNLIRWETNLLHAKSMAHYWKKKQLEADDFNEYKAGFAIRQYNRRIELENLD